MDPETTKWLLIIAGIGAQLTIAIAAIFAGIAARDARRTSNDTKAETALQTTTINKVAVDTAVVLGHVNSKETRLTATIESQSRELQIMRDQLADKDRIAALLAQAVAQRSRADDYVTPTVQGPGSTTVPIDHVDEVVIDPKE